MHPDPEFLNLCDRPGHHGDARSLRRLDRTQVHRRLRPASSIATGTNAATSPTPSCATATTPPSSSMAPGNTANPRQPGRSRNAISPKLIAIYKKLDPTRPVTQALFRPENPGGAYTNGIADMLDVVGTNYRPNLLADLYQNPPAMESHRHRRQRFRALGAGDARQPLPLRRIPLDRHRLPRRRHRTGDRPGLWPLRPHE